jgi:hypothetical protein
MREVVTQTRILKFFKECTSFIRDLQGIFQNNSDMLAEVSIWYKKSPSSKFW